MNFTDIFVRRPVLASVISLLILVIGVRSVTLLDLREYPETQSTVVSVTTAYPGADGELIQSFITAPLQRAISEAEGIDYIESVSSQSISRIQVHMDLNYNPHAAIAEIQAKVASQRNILPQEAEDPVIYSGTGGSMALMYIAFYSDEMTPPEITDYLRRTVRPKLQAIPGVAKADTNGDQSFAMRIWMDPIRMAALDVTATDVHDTLRQNNFLAGVGNTKGDYVAVNLTASTGISSETAFGDLIIRQEGGTLVRLRDVAEIELGAKNYSLTSWYNGQMAIMVGIDMAPGANPLTVAADIRDLLPDIERQLPSGLKVSLVHDTSEDIQHSIEEVFKTLAEAVLIVLFLIYLSLGSWRAAIVPAVSVPLSLIGSAFLMMLFGFSINLLTLLAMLLAIGLVVDDAIVVVENVHRHIQNGEKPVPAALKAARELSMPIISMTTTLLAVYAPIGFMGGLVGILFTEFAFSLAGAVLISGIVALTLSPMLSAAVLKNDANPGKFEMVVEHFFERLAGWYRRALGATLNAQPVTMLFSAVVIVSIYFMFISSASELAPKESASFHNVMARAPDTATIEYVKPYGQQIITAFEETPEYLRSFLMIGGGGSPAQTYGGMRFIPEGERDMLPPDLQNRSKDEITGGLQAALSKIAGLDIVLFQRPTLPGAAGGLPVQFVITSDQDYDQLVRLADEVIGQGMQSGNFVFMRKSIEMSLPRTEVVIDRDRAGDLGISMEDIGRSLATMLGDNNVNRFSLHGRSYEVVPQVAREFRQNYELLDNFYVRAASGELVPLSNLVKFEHHVEPTERVQFQQLNAVTVEGVPTPGVTLGVALDYLEGVAAATFPQEFSYDYVGESRQFVEQGSALVITFFLSLVIIYLVLAAQFESWRDPLIILISVPMSIAGALIFVTLGAASINIYTQVGMITLIGLIAKNGILIVDFANQLQVNESLGKRAAVIQAASVRLRPILMTTVAMLVAMVPLLMATGMGSISRFQIGLVIITGLGIGTMFTLFVVPAFYLLLARDRSQTETVDYVPAE
jgi:multidrug efflux pump